MLPTPLSRRLLAGALLLTVSLTPTLATASPETPLLPLRALAEAAGARVDWDGTAAPVTLGGRTLSIAPGQSTAIANGETIALEATAELVGGRLLVPPSLLRTGLGLQQPVSVMATFEHAFADLFAPDWAPQLEAFVQQIAPLDGCPGMAVGVAQQGEPIYLHSVGARQCEEALPMTVNTVMGVGSATKTFTAVAIMQLQEIGRLSVHDPISKYLPEYSTSNPEWAAQTTIHHLLTHSAGLAPQPTLYYAMAKSLAADPSVPAELRNLPPIHTGAELMTALAESPIPLIGPPGAYFSYSNDAYALLGEIIARVSGTSFETYVTEQILKPAGMHHSTFDHETMLTYPEYATLYTPVPSQAKPGALTGIATPVWWEGGPMTSAGFLRSTVQDMLRFAEIFRNKGVVGTTRILREASVEAMMTPHIEADMGAHYGYGLIIYPNHNGMKLVQHDGALKGIAALFAVIPEKGLTAVGLSNAQGMPSGLLATGALNLATGFPVMQPQARAPYEVDPARLADYAGQYAGGEAAPMQISAENGQLIWEQAGIKLRAMPVGEHQFLLQLGLSELLLTFLPDESGQFFGMRIGFRILLKVDEA